MTLDPQSATPVTSTPRNTDVAGWKFNAAAGIVPFLAGAVTLATTWLGVAHADAPWPTGLSSLGFSFSSLPAAGDGLQQWVQLTGSVGGVNVIAAAVAVSVVARFGLRTGQRWAWWFLAFCFVWVGLHDAVAATRFFAETGQPVMLMPYTYCTLMIVGLLRSRAAVFGPQHAPATRLH